MSTQKTLLGCKGMYNVGSISQRARLIFSTKQIVIAKQSDVISQYNMVIMTTQLKMNL